MRIIKIISLLFLVLIIVCNVIYWKDPWFWRRYTVALTSFASDELKPYDIIEGNGGFNIPLAEKKKQSVLQSALDDASSYAESFNSYALIVVHNGKIQLEWYPEARSAFQFTKSQSMSKTLLAVLIGIAVDEGYINSVNEPVSNYIDEWSDDRRGEITIKNLMQMSSGLAQYPFDLNPFNNNMDCLFSGYSTKAILKTPLAEWGQGSRFDYNNLNSEILGIIIERATSRRFSDYLKEKIWDPIGGGEARIWLDRKNGKAHTSCCVAATAMDWTRFGMLLLGGGEINGQRIFSESWFKAMVEPSPAAEHYGYQIWLGYSDPPFPMPPFPTGVKASEPYLARDTFLTWGRGQQHIWVSQANQLVIVRLGPVYDWDVTKPEFDLTLIPNSIVRGIVSVSGMNTSELN